MNNPCLICGSTYPLRDLHTCHDYSCGIPCVVFVCNTCIGTITPGNPAGNPTNQKEHKGAYYVIHVEGKDPIIVSKEEYIKFEKAAGFHSKLGPGTVACSSFSSGNISGHVVSGPSAAVVSAGTATDHAIRILKHPVGHSDSELIDAVKQVIGYTPAQAIAGNKEISSSDLLTDIQEFGSLLN